MNALSLYKFIEDNNIEWHWHEKEEESDVIIFVNYWDLKEWFELLKDHPLLDEDGYECVMKDTYLCIWMRSLCEYSDIEIEEVFDKSKES